MRSMVRIVSIFLVLTMSVPALADTAENPDPPRTIEAGQVILNPKDGTQWSPANSGAFITDAYSQAKLNAFKRVTQERDGFKAKLEERPAHGLVIGVAVGASVVTAVVAVVCTLFATGNLK